MTLTGSMIKPFQIGPLLGKGSYGDIYAARNTEKGTLVALKVESINSQRHVLETEAQIMRKINQFNYFPEYITFGKTKNYIFLAMELCGPSLSYAIKNLPDHKLSLSSGIRTIYIILKGLHQMHRIGILHRDVKPSNILLRTSKQCPLAIIDFGLSRIYIDKWTKKQLPPRKNPGFRGTTVFASPNAHLHMELAPRDDLISWYYMSLDLINGPLPWRTLENRADILQRKRSTNVSMLGSQIAPQFEKIWRHISTLNYEDEPNYKYLYELLDEVMQQNNINWDDQYDWDPNILHLDPASEADNNRSSLSSEASVHEAEELPPPPTATMYKSVDPTPLIVVKSSRAEVVNTMARDEDQCCCCKIA